MSISSTELYRSICSRKSLTSNSSIFREFAFFVVVDAVVESMMLSGEISFS
jgi:hypothetical protein